MYIPRYATELQDCHTQHEATNNSDSIDNFSFQRDCFSTSIINITRLTFTFRYNAHRLFSIRFARFLLVQHTKTGKTYQMTIKYTKWSQNIPNGRKIDNNMCQYLSLQDSPKFTQIGILGLKLYHLANLFSIQLTY
jgi:hypothetical protein